MAAIRIALLTIRLVMRTKVALFFTFIFPLGFLFIYAGIFAHGAPAAVAYMFGPVVTLNIMASAFWGLGLQTVTQRERGSLRRYRLAPIGAATMVSSSLLANYLLELPTVALMTACAMLVFHMPLRIGVPALLALVTIGTFGFAGFGLIIASVANTMQEAQIYNNIAWLVLLFLSGATIPLPVLPHWLQRFAAFLPATYLVTSFQAIMVNSEPLRRHWPELVALVASGTFGLLFAWKLFRWEKEDHVPRSSKLAALAFVVPFICIGVWMNARGNSTTSSWAATFGAIDRSPSAPRAPAPRQLSVVTAPAPPGSESGLVSDFDDGTTHTKFGAGWVVSTDSVMGGKSTAGFKVIPGGAEGSKGSLEITGEIALGSPYPWAGAMFCPGAQPFAPANLSGKKQISFWAKGDGKTYRLMMFSQRLGQIPASQSFVAGGNWKQYTFPLSAFNGIDGRDLEGILFSAGTVPGKFSFQIDGVRFQ